MSIPLTIFLKLYLRNSVNYNYKYISIYLTENANYVISAFEVDKGCSRIQSTTRLANGGQVRLDRGDRHFGKYTMSVTVRLTTVNAHRIRRFEQFGLLSPARTGAGQRLFSDVEVDLIREIILLEKEGVNLGGIRMILAMRRGERR